MKSYGSFLLLQLARFGAMTVPQMLELCSGRCRKSSLYRTLSELKARRLLARISHTTKPLIGYAATSDAYALVRGETYERKPGIRLRDLQHTLDCAETMLALSRYSHVTGLATESEIDRAELPHFSLNKVPDGILKLRLDDHEFEIAVEVESTLKNGREIDEILNTYHRVLSRPLLCRGLIVVAMEPAILDEYRNRVASMPREIESRVLIIASSELNQLDPKFFGHRLPGPNPCLELVRKHFQGGAKYLAMKSTEPARNGPLEGHYKEGQSEFPPEVRS